MPDTAELLAVLRQSGFEFDQAIHYRKRNFLHVSLKKTGTNRMQVLLASFGSGILVIGVWGKPEKPEAGGGNFYGFCPIFFM